MAYKNPVFLMILFFCSFNAALALLFWLHEKIERSKMNKLKSAVEKSVRAVEQVCSGLESTEKKRDAVARVQALLGIYKWMIPTLVIDTVIEAELFVIQQMHQRLSVDHDMEDEVTNGEGSD